MINKILFKGTFKKAKVQIDLNKSTSRKINTALEKKCELVWAKTLAISEKKGYQIWDNTVYRLDKFEQTDNHLRLKLSTIPFRIRISMNQFTEELLNLGGDYYPMAMYSSVYVKTRDDNFVFVSKSNKYHKNRKYSFIGGVINNEDQKLENTKDLWECTKSEIREETGIDDDQIEEVNLKGGYINHTANVCLVFACSLTCNSKELETIFKQKHDKEVENLEFVSRESVRDFVLNKIEIQDNILDILDY